MDTGFFAPQGRKEQNGRVRFLLVGRRQPQKGVDLLLHAVKELKSIGLEEKFEVQLCGADSPGHDYKALAFELGVSHLVHFLPFQKDMKQFYNDAHCFLLPSRGEGLSNALLEAMAMELPVIATRVSGTPEVVTDGKDGILIPPDSVGALVEKMKQIILYSELRQILGRNARFRVTS
ncbi:glycosyltransferase, partial [bacterium]|nr:glycosyltransferase [bacterium]